MLDTNAVSAFLQRRAPRLDGWVREQRLAALDLLIASHALSEGCTLVTADQAFTHVAELHLEAW
jgi:predicted nucleic acid-binding protein